MSESFIADVVTSPTDAWPSNSANLPTPSSNLPAAALGDYELHREIGRGGMGVVYEATQLSLRRSVAIKTLPFAAVLDQQQVTRFRNEAQAAASLHHPHIVPVYAVGCERGVHYYSMQLIDGDTLAQTLLSLQATEAERLRAEKLSELRRDEAKRDEAELTAEMQLRHISDSKSDGIDLPQAHAVAGHAAAGAAVAGAATSREVKDHGSTVQSVRDRQGIRSIVQLFVDVAEALDYAHEQGVLHRDIKPSNLLIDGSGKIWVTDFGLARCRGIGNLTAEGSVLGTARYMSPEQIAGRSQAVDHRTDIYSLGITLYEMLTLRPAFSAPTREHLLRSVETQQPVSPRRINPKIATDLETILLKAIAKSKDERYATAGDMADDLRRYLSGVPALARRPGKIDLAFRWAVRHRQAVTLTLFLFLLTFVSLAGATMLIDEQRREAQRQADIAKKSLNSTLRFTDSVNGLAIEKLRKLPGGDQVLADMLSLSNKFATDFLRYADRNSLFAIEAAKSHFLLGRIESEQGNDQVAEEHYLQAILCYGELPKSPPNDSDVASDHAICLHQLAALYKQQGRYLDAKAIYQKAIDQHQGSLAMSDKNSPVVSQWASTQINFAQLQDELGEHAPALDRMVDVESRLAQCVQNAPLDPNLHLALIECRNLLAGLVLESHPDIAEQLFRKNIAAIDGVPLAPSPQHRWSLASADRTRGGFAKRSPACQRAIAQNNLADLLAKKHQLTEAIELTLVSVEIFQHCLLANPRDRVIRKHLAIAQNNLGQRLFSRAGKGDVDRAECAFEQAHKAFRSLISAENCDPLLHSRLAGVLYNISVAKQKRGELELALKHLTDAAEIQNLACRQVPLNHSLGDLFRLYDKSRVELLQKLKPTANSTKHTTQVTAGRTGLDVES